MSEERGGEGGMSRSGGVQGSKGTDGGMSRFEVGVGRRRNKGKRTGECGASGGKKCGARGLKRTLNIHSTLWTICTCLGQGFQLGWSTQDSKLDNDPFNYHIFYVSLVL